MPGRMSASAMEENPTSTTPSAARRGWPSTSWWDTPPHRRRQRRPRARPGCAVAHAHEQVQPRAAFQYVHLAAHIFAQRRRERVVLAAVSRLHATQVAAPRAVGHEAREHLLVEPGHRRVRAGEGLAPPLKEGRGQHEVVHAQGGGERFRERAHVDDAAPVVHGGQRRQRAAPGSGSRGSSRPLGCRRRRPRPTRARARAHRSA